MVALTTSWIYLMINIIVTTKIEKYVIKLIKNLKFGAN